MKRILVVDNDLLILEFVKDLLEENGHEVRVAEDGLKALDILKTYFPDLIFVDLVMPNIDGRQLCQAIRKMKRQENSIIAVMSALVAEEQDNIADLGSDILIAKGPFPELSRNILSVVKNPEENRLKCLGGDVLGAEDIWPRKITQELLSANQHFKIILEKMKEGILEIEADGRIISVNSSVRFLTGLSESDLLGTRFATLFAEEHQRRITELLKQNGETKKIVEIDEKSPALFCGRLVVLNIIPLKDHAVIIINDITERKRKELELRESQGLIGSLVDNMLDAAVIIDQSGEILFANNAAAELMDMTSPQDVVGKHVREFIHPDYIKSVIRNYLMVKRHHARFLNEYKIITSEGREKDVEGLGTNIMFKGMPAHIVTLRDISERKSSEKKIRDGIIRLSNNLEETVISLASAFEMKDPYTAGHQRRVTEIASAIALEMAIEKDCFQGMRLASLVHDIGKINVPAEILSKPGKITEPEFALIRTHSQAGYDILKKINFPWPISRIVLQHHERMDGSGYPNGLSGQEILLEARIIAVADVIEAMATHRPYRASLGIEKALEEIERNRGLLYDKDVANTCLHLFRSGKFQLETA
ncbi:MAG: PAS domain S-box protein [Deltaproteobacteria bacterium]|nr:PAS domain S-box protein [Deltaproteobacteria bacterium]